jgi:hypothetical protein
VRRNGLEGLWCETECDPSALMSHGMVLKDCGVKRNGSVRLWC